VAEGAVDEHVGEEGSWEEMVEGRWREMGWVARCSWRGAVESGRRWGGWREACRSCLRSFSFSFSAAMAPAKRSSPKKAVEGTLKKARSQTPEAIVAQKLRDNFKGMGPEETDVTKAPDGKTLREKLLHDYTAEKSGIRDVTFGKIYYDSLKTIYEKKSNAYQALEAKNPDIVVSPIFVQAMLAAQRAKPDRSLFTTYMSTTQAVPNAREIVGLFRWFLSLKVGCNKQLAVALEGLRFIQRLSLHTVYQQKFNAIRDWADQVLVTTLNKTRCEKNSKLSFANVHRQLIELIVDGAKLAKVEGCEGNFTAVAKELLELASASALGRQLFQEQLAAAVAEAVAKTVKEEVQNLFGKTGTISPGRYEEAKRSALLKVSAIDGVDALPMKRQIQLPYRCQVVPAKVGSLREEVGLHFASALKGHAVESKQLVELWCECLLVPSGTCTKYKAKLDTALLKEPNASRTMVQNLIQDSSADSADLIQKMIFQKSTALLLMDADFQVELALLSSLTSDGAQAKINMEIMQCMPSAEKKFTCEETAQLLKNLAAGSLYTMSSRSGQQRLRMTQQLVDAVVEGRRPETTVVAQCTFLAEVVGRFQWFKNVGGGGRGAPSTALRPSRR
jgi:hypothetical protein